MIAVVLRFLPSAEHLCREVQVLVLVLDGRLDLLPYCQSFHPETKMISGLPCLARASCLRSDFPAGV